jgi:hypothetical protein
MLSIIMPINIASRCNKQEINRGDNVHDNNLHSSSLDSKTRQSWNSNCKAMRGLFIYARVC